MTKVISNRKCKNCQYYCRDIPEWSCYGSPDYICNNKNSLYYDYIINDENFICECWKGFK